MTHPLENFLRLVIASPEFQADFAALHATPTPAPRLLRCPVHGVLIHKEALRQCPLPGCGYTLNQTTAPNLKPRTRVLVETLRAARLKAQRKAEAARWRERRRAKEAK